MALGLAQPVDESEQPLLPSGAIRDLRLELRRGELLGLGLQVAEQRLPPHAGSLPASPSNVNRS